MKKQEIDLEDSYNEPFDNPEAITDEVVKEEDELRQEETAEEEQVSREEE